MGVRTTDEVIHGGSGSLLLLPDDTCAHLPLEVQPVEHVLQSRYFLFYEVSIPICGV